MRAIKMLAACSLLILSLPFAQQACAQLLDNPGGGGMGGVGQYRARFEQRSYTFEPTGQQMPYLVFKSTRVSKKKPAPLLIALHGTGAGPDTAIGMFAAGADQRGFIVAAPVGYNLSGWYGIAGLVSPETARLSEQAVMNMLEQVRAEFNVDPRRIYIAGQSMGGIGAIYLASKYPDIWAGVGAVSPGFTGVIARMKGIVDYTAAPIIVEHGDKDDLIPVQLVRDWVAGVKERKVTIKYNEQRGGTHFTTAQGGTRVMDFLAKQSRPETKPAQK